jgi:zinc protease
MLSEQLMHPVINQIGVDTQNEVVKEEKRLRNDNQPYGNLVSETIKLLFKKHPYRWMPIGSMGHLDAATLEEFLAFHKKYYVPNNGVLVVAGDIDVPAVKKMIQDYFGPIPRGKEIERSYPTEDQITETIYGKAYDANIQIPAVVAAYRTPGFKERDAFILDMISSYLSGGKSSVLYKKLVDEQKQALAVQAVNLSLEDYGIYVLFGIPLGDVPLMDLLAEMDEEVVKIQNELISERDYQKLQNQFENQFVNSNSSVESIASSLAEYYVYFNDTNLINNKIDIYRSITREEIQQVAKKYLNPNQRVELQYLPKKNDH